MTLSQRRERVENYDTYIEVPLIFEYIKEEDFNTDFKCVATNTRGLQVHMTQVKQEGTVTLLTEALLFCSTSAKYL